MVRQNQVPRSSFFYHAKTSLLDLCLQGTFYVTVHIFFWTTLLLLQFKFTVSGHIYWNMTHLLLQYIFTVEGQCYCCRIHTIAWHIYCCSKNLLLQDTFSITWHIYCSRRGEEGERWLNKIKILHWIIILKKWNSLSGFFIMTISALLELETVYIFLYWPWKPDTFLYVLY